MFHAVSLEPGVEMAKVLAFSEAGLRAGVERVEKAQLELTAVIEPAARMGATDEEPERLEMYRFGVVTMEEHNIGHGPGGGYGAAGAADLKGSHRLPANS